MSQVLRATNLKWFQITIIALGAYQSVWASNNCKNLVGSPHDNQSSERKSIWSTLNPRNNAAEIVNYLSYSAELNKIYLSSAGVSEGYTVKEHTLRVFDVFAQQYELYKRMYNISAPPGIRLIETLRLTIALHDIGKPLAIEAGSKSDTHDYSSKILARVFDGFGFSNPEKRLATSLVGNDILGDLAKGKIDAPAAKENLARVAEEAGIPLRQFAPLQFMFYTIDAASYPILRQNFFSANEEGMLVPKNSAIEQVRDLIFAEENEPMDQSSLRDVNSKGNQGDHVRSSSIGLVDSKLLKEIVQKPDNKEIPESLFREFSTNELARAIVSRVRAQEIALRDEYKTEKPIDFQKGVDIILFFWSKNLSLIVRNGFLNTHEAHPDLNNVPRIAGEDTFTGLKIGTSALAKRLRGKSAFLNIRENVEVAKGDVTMMNIGQPQSYGDIGAVFKASVRDRAVWSASDSLILAMRLEGQSSKEWIKWRGTFDRRSISSKEMEFPMYYETVVYGDLTVDDVEYFLVTDPHQVEKLRNLGKPVYLAERMIRNNRVVFGKGDLLFDGAGVPLLPSNSQ